LVEHLICNHEVTGSIPVAGSIRIYYFMEAFRENGGCVSVLQSLYPPQLKVHSSGFLSRM
jgi:hypothetical protein